MTFKVIIRKVVKGMIAVQFALLLATILLPSPWWFVTMMFAIALGAMSISICDSFQRTLGEEL